MKGRLTSRDLLPILFSLSSFLVKETSIVLPGSLLSDGTGTRGGTLRGPPKKTYLVTYLKVLGYGDRCRLPWSYPWTRSLSVRSPTRHQTLHETRFETGNLLLPLTRPEKYQKENLHITLILPPYKMLRLTIEKGL